MACLYFIKAHSAFVAKQNKNKSALNNSKFELYTQSFLSNEMIVIIYFLWNQKMDNLYSWCPLPCTGILFRFFSSMFTLLNFPSKQTENVNLEILILNEIISQSFPGKTMAAKRVSFLSSNLDVFSEKTVFIFYNIIKKRNI